MKYLPPSTSKWLWTIILALIGDFVLVILYVFTMRDFGIFLVTFIVNLTLLVSGIGVIHFILKGFWIKFSMEEIKVLKKLDQTTTHSLQYTLQDEKVVKLTLRWTKPKGVHPLKTLKNIILFGNLEEIDLAPLSKLTNLKELKLWSDTALSLPPLNDLDDLHKLHLSSPKIWNFSTLRGLQNLQRLFLSGTDVKDLDPIKNLRKLQVLDLSHTEVSDVFPLKNLKTLEFLWLRHTNVSDLSPLKKLNDLQKLRLDNTPVSDLNPLRNLQNLQTLSVSNTTVSDPTPLRAICNLEHVNLSGTKIGFNNDTLKLLRRRGITVIV